MFPENGRENTVGDGTHVAKVAVKGSDLGFFFRWTLHEYRHNCGWLVNANWFVAMMVDVQNLVNNN